MLVTPLTPSHLASFDAFRAATADSVAAAAEPSQQQQQCALLAAFHCARRLQEEGWTHLQLVPTLLASPQWALRGKSLRRAKAEAAAAAAANADSASAAASADAASSDELDVAVPLSFVEQQIRLPAIFSALACSRVLLCVRSAPQPQSSLTFFPAYRGVFHVLPRSVLTKRAGEADGANDDADEADGRGRPQQTGRQRKERKRRREGQEEQQQKKQQMQQPAAAVQLHVESSLSLPASASLPLAPAAALPPPLQPAARRARRVRHDE